MGKSNCIYFNWNFDFISSF